MQIHKLNIIHMVQSLQMYTQDNYYYCNFVTVAMQIITVLIQSTR